VNFVKFLRTFLLCLLRDSVCPEAHCNGHRRVDSSTGSVLFRREIGLGSPLQGSWLVRAFPQGVALGCGWVALSALSLGGCAYPITGMPGGNHAAMPDRESAFRRLATPIAPKGQANPSPGQSAATPWVSACFGALNGRPNRVRTGSPLQRSVSVGAPFPRALPWAVVGSRFQRLFGRLMSSSGLSVPLSLAATFSGEPPAFAPQGKGDKGERGLNTQFTPAPCQDQHHGSPQITRPPPNAERVLRFLRPLRFYPLPPVSAIRFGPTSEPMSLQWSTEHRMRTVPSVSSVVISLPQKAFTPNRVN